MSNVIVKNDRYTVDSLFQWDKDQELKIYGVSVPSIPEIHFTNDSMERAIVRQASLDDAGVISVNIPNSLLQKPYTITAYICIYEGETFKSVCEIQIPVKARKQPSDYTIEDDEEIYSFNAVENFVANTVDKINADYAVVEAKYNETNAKYEEVNTKYNEAVNELNEAETALLSAIESTEQSKTDYDNAKTAYDNASEMVNQFLEDSGDILAEIQSKANKSSVVEATLLASVWSEGTYSFETTYPVATYDIEISLNNTATVEELTAFNSAQIVGSATSNIIKAFGDVPTIDIPIIIKVVEK